MKLNAFYCSARPTRHVWADTRFRGPCPFCGARAIPKAAAALSVDAPSAIKEAAVSHRPFHHRAEEAAA